MGGSRSSCVVRSVFQAALLMAGLGVVANAQTQPLAIVTTAFPPGVVGAPYSFQLVASGGTTPYTWGVQPAIVTLPTPGQISPGVLVDAKTGLVSGTPTSSGTFSFTLTLTDAANGAVNKVFQVVITPAGPLGITTTTLPGGTVGVKYSQQLGATGGAPPYKWSIASGTLPVGLSFDLPTGLISGTPTTAVSANLVFALADSASTSGSARQALTLAVVNPPPVAITTASLKGGFTGAPYQDQLAATGGVPPYHWAIASGALPPGLSLDSVSGAITGRPTASGTSSFTIRVTDSGTLNALATQTYSIVIAAATAVTVTAATLPDATAGSSYSQSLVAGGGAPPYTWSVVAGTVPPGMALSASGVLQGLATVPGTFTFNAQSTDSAGGSGAGYITVTVKASGVSLQVDTPPSGMVGVPYPVQVVTAAGGVVLYTFAISSGALPTGIALIDGKLQGTPTAAGTFNFTITATDSNSPAGTASAPLQVIVRPSQTDIALSTGSLSFTLNAGAASVPGAENLVVTSTSSTTPATFSVSVSPAVPWLSVTGSATGTTPSSFTVSLNSQALSLAAAPTPYKTTILFTCVTPAACAGYTNQSVAVSLNVNPGVPQLQLTKQLVSLTATSPALITGSFGVQNAGGGTLTINSATAADGWLAVSGLGSAVAGGAVSLGTITVSPNGFAPGYYRSNITINTSAGTANLPVTLLVASTAFLNLNPGGQLFQMTAGGAVGNANASFAVTVQGSSSVSWSASVLPGAPWLSLKTTSGTSTAATPGTVSFSIDPSASAALTAKAYYGTIRVSSGQTANSPQDFLVVLNVGQSSDAVTLEPAPGGLFFVAAGSTAVTPQTVQVFAGSGAATAYQAAAATAGGKNWLSVTPNTGSARAGVPGTATVSVNQAGLAPDIYRGTVTYSVSPASVRTVNVTFVVAPVFSSIPLSSVGGQLQPRQATLGCTPTQLVPTSNFNSDFSQPLAWPVPIVVQLANNCGTIIGDGTVEVTFPTSSDPPLALKADPASPGRYFGTWIPRKAASQVSIGVNAQAAGFPPAVIQVTGKVVPNSVPVLTAQGTSNAFSGSPGGVAPGTAVQIYGSNLAAPGTSAVASSVPFQTSLAGTSVLIGGIPAPLYFVSPGQINALVPLEVPPGSQAQVVVLANNVPTAPDPVPVPSATPGIAAFSSGALIAQHSDFSLVLPTAPAKPGENLIIYLAGLGATSNQPASGAGAPAPPTDPKVPIALTLNGNVLPTLFVGLTPGSVGLYQVNFQLPADTPDGDLTLRVTQGAASSNVTILPVRR